MTCTFREGIALVALLASAGLARADVKIEEKNQMKLEGAVGSVLNRFAGKAAKEGLVQSVAVKGDRKVTLGDDSGEIVDLAEEKIYRLDRRKQTYTVTTFAELRKELEEARRETGDEERKDQKEPARAEEQMEVDLDVKETGEKKKINGFETRQVITTITARKKGQTLEQGGGTVITADSWLSRDVKARNEVAAFDKRYAEKLFGKSAAVTAEMALAAMSAPGMAEGMARLREQGAKLEGYPIVTATMVEKVKAADQAAAEAKPEESGGDLRGLGGMFAKKLAKKATSKPPSSRSVVMTLRNEVLSVSPAVSTEEMALPAGYREQKRK